MQGLYVDHGFQGFYLYSWTWEVLEGASLWEFEGPHKLSGVFILGGAHSTPVETVQNQDSILQASFSCSLPLFPTPSISQHTVCGRKQPSVQERTAGSDCENAWHAWISRSPSSVQSYSLKAARNRNGPTKETSSRHLWSSSPDQTTHCFHFSFWILFYRNTGILQVRLGRGD